MKKPTVGKLKKKLDTIYSRYIRLNNADHLGYCACISCGLVFHWKEIQCGHFVSRRYSNTRYNEKNTMPQCMGCNVFRGGNNANFALGLKKKYGDRIIEELATESRKLKKFKIAELQELIEKYSALVKSMGGMEF